MKNTLRPTFGIRGSGGPRPAALRSVSGLPKGQGPVGTAANPSPQFVNTGRTMTPAYKPTPNSGGLIQGPGRTTTYIPPDPGYKDPLPTGAEDGPSADALSHVVQRPGSPSAPAAPQAAPTPPAVGEAANPLSNGANGPQVEGQKDEVKPISPPPVQAAGKEVNAGRILGVSSRGNRAPGGSDTDSADHAAPPVPAVESDATQTNSFVAGDPNAPGGQLAAQPGDATPASLPTPTPKASTSPAQNISDSTPAPDSVDGDTAELHVGGHDPYQRTFKSAKAADLYHDFYQKLTGDNRPRPVSSTATQQAATAPKGRDNGDAMSGDDEQD